MAWSFGDSFDLYAATADAINGYWDSGSGNANLVVGRFAGSRAISGSLNSATTAVLAKASGANDAVHHVVVSFQQTAAITGSSLAGWFTLYDGTTAQCSIVFRSDGAILLVSGASNSGTTLATYTGAFPVASTWYAFEIEVVINNTTGSFAVRKNGNPVNDFTLGSLNTRGGTANNYANKLGLGTASTTQNHCFDDLFWKSDASSVAWLGDIRCYARMPASDASVTFSRAPPIVTLSPFANSSTQTPSATAPRYTPFTCAADGVLNTATLIFVAGYTGNLKCSIFASSGTAPTTVLGSANLLTNPATGGNTLTFGTPVSLTGGTQYYIGFASDTASGTWNVAGAATGVTGNLAYASFPTASPSGMSGTPAIVCTLNITLSKNASYVAEPQQDGLTSYVYDSNPGDADFYGIGSIASTPATVIATTTRAYMQKSDAGTRTAAVQLKSGATTVASPTLTLTTSGWLWAWRTDLVDPNTGAAWTPAAVNNAQIGPKTIA